MKNGTKPAMPSSRDVAIELGIVPYTAGWRERVRACRSESALHTRYEEALKMWERSEEAAKEREHQAARQAEKAEKAAKLKAIGCEYLIGAQFTRSKRGTVAAVFSRPGPRGRRAIASPISRAACEVLGMTPGPGND